MGGHVGNKTSEQEEPHVGAVLRSLRKDRGLSLQKLAEASGVSVGMISQIERGIANPSVRVLTAVRRSLNVPMQELFGEPASAPSGGDPEFVRRVKDRPVIRLGSGVNKELLTAGGRQHLQIMILKIEPGGETGGHALSYPAEKGGLVMSGRILLKIDDEVAELSAGDSFVFDSARPHGIRNDSDVPAEVLWIIGAVQFDRHF